MASAFNTFGSVFIDGVPVKLNDHFKPPTKVTLPAEFEIGNPTEVLFMEYDFSLEKSVIAWSDERKKHIEQQKAQEKLLQEQKQKEFREQQKAQEEYVIEQKKKQEQLQEQQKQALKQAEQDLNTDNELVNKDGFREDNKDNRDISKENISVVTGLDTKESVVSKIDQNYSNVAFQQSHLFSKDNFTVPSNISQKVQPAPPPQLFSKNQPVFYSAGQDILTPLPASNPAATQKSSSGPSSFNPADFENELDPFDNLELKTLDDMKELDKVLQNVKINENSSELLQQPSGPSSSIVQSTVISHNPSSVVPTMHQNSQPGGYTQTVSSYSQSPQSGIVESSVKHGYVQSVGKIDFPNIDYGNSDSVGNPVASNTETESNSVNINQTSGSVSFKAFSGNYSGNNSNVNGRYVPTSGIHNWNLGASGGQSNIPVTLTPCSSSSSNFSGTSALYTSSSASSSSCSSNVQNSVVNQHPSHIVQQAPNQYQIWREFLQNNSNSAANNSYQNSSATNFVNMPPSSFSQVNGYVNYVQENPINKDSGSGTRSQNHSRSSTPTHGMGKLRSARSTPDLVALANNSEIAQTKSPPIPRRMKSPPPTSSFCDRNLQALESTNRHTMEVISSTETDIDPYRSMSGESRRFVDSLTNMGFRRITVSKAVQRIGMDEKMVLDFLCGITRLKENGISEKEAEAILLLPEKDQQTAKDFYILCKRFQEFGFEEYKVREGLMKCNLDEEKTLDWLTAN